MYLRERERDREREREIGRQREMERERKVPLLTNTCQENLDLSHIHI